MSKTGDMALDEQVRDEMARAAGPELAKALRAASGYMLNAKIDLEIGRTKQTAIYTLEDGLNMIRAALKAAGLEP